MPEQWMILISKSLSLEFDEVSSMESNCVPTWMRKISKMWRYEFLLCLRMLNMNEMQVRKNDQKRLEKIIVCNDDQYSVNIDYHVIQNLSKTLEKIN